MTWRLTLLGGVSLASAAAAAPPGAAQRRSLALLAVLAAHAERGIARDKLQALLWPEADDATASRRLKQAIYVLRRDLGADAVVGTADLRLVSEVVSCDLVDFEHRIREGDLEQAVATYRGPFLDGFHVGGDSIELERWADQERSRIDRAFRQAVEKLAERAGARNDWMAALGWWQRLGQFDPLDGRYASAIVATLLRLGDRAGAVRQADAHRALLATELGLPPDVELGRLVASIRAAPHDVGTRAATTEPFHGPLPVAAYASGVLAAPVMEPEPPGSKPAASVWRGTVGGARPRLGRRWHSVGVAAGLALALGVGAALRGDPPLAAHRVVVATPRGAPVAGSLEDLLVARIAEGLAGRDPLLGVSRAGSRDAAGARYRVEASSWARADSVWFSADVTDAVDPRLLASIAPVIAVGGAEEAAIRTLSDRIAIRLATRRNPMFVSWAHAAASTDSWEAFETLDLGIRALARSEPAAAGHFAEASTLDTMSATPVLWAAFGAMDRSDRPDLDSILSSLEQSSRRFGPWDRALHGFLRAMARGDIAGAHLKGHDLLDVVPGSEWAVPLAHVAIDLGRYREALVLLDQLRPDSGWARGWRRPAVLRDIALHLTGQYQAELDAARSALQSDPDFRLYLQLEVKALVGLGRIDEVAERCERSMSLRAEPRLTDWQPCGQAIAELSAHGHLPAATALAERFLAARHQGNRLSRAERLFERARAYTDLDWQEVLNALEQIPPSDRTDPDYLALLGLAQAARGDRQGMAATVRRMETRARPTGDGAPSVLLRAELAALLGDRDEAVALLGRALREGDRIRHLLHVGSRFRGLHGYWPFDALWKPVEDSAHLKRITGRR